jgi:hypothetical protein
MAQNPLPNPFPNPTPASGKDLGEGGPTEKLESFSELVAELNRQLLQLEYALLDLKEALLPFDRREHEGLERQAAQQIERIRRKAS